MAFVECDEKSLAVLDAASSVFLANGFSGATTDMIQKRARVSKATLYACFPTKEALFAAVIEHECSAMAQTIEAMTPASGDITRTLGDLGRSYLRIILSPTGLALFRVSIAEAPRFPELARRFYLAGPRVVANLIAEHLEAAAQAGEIDIQNVGLENAAGLFISLLRGEGQMECLIHPQALPSEEQVERWVKLAVQTFLSAFRKP
ncbi:TetR/AcrR family transcriptional regulator [Pseudomonas sp. LRF_L74]|uniref:TetR/AcrR family transcriptional regulator n=1 Tax=Pseudomonas sp. LRF_L74 TaxID=3369422 RepID=UPI003F623EA3